MNDSLSTTLVEPPESKSPTTKLWTPRLIGIVTLLVGFPSGMVLTSINSARMNVRSKALVRLAAAPAQTTPPLPLAISIVHSRPKSIKMAKLPTSPPFGMLASWQLGNLPCTLCPTARRRALRKEGRDETFVVCMRLHVRYT